LLDRNGVALIDRLTTMTAPSIQVLSLLQARRKSSRSETKTALVVGNPKMPDLPSGGILDQLPDAEEEAFDIATMLNSKPLIGAEATKERILREAPLHRVIHLATHGILGNDAALGAVALAPTDGDGLLRAEEIMQLHWEADLVVLSACFTGGGQIMPDGVIGLSRAVLAAGAASVVVSLREIPDSETALLMHVFYEHYLRTGDKADALRRAMRKVRAKAPDPLYWAYFTIIGERIDAALKPSQTPHP
jgi:CHAT domain-containing protein